MSVKDIKVVDLFCGVGVLTNGLKQGGLSAEAGVDNDSTCRHAFETNNKSTFVDADICNFDFSILKDG